jgi:Zn-finger nucleic acid-binding protein
MQSRALGDTGLTALECERCAGLWLGEEVFRSLSERARSEEDPAPDAAEVRDEAASGIARTASRAYRRCPVCRSMMNRSNFGRRSGVLVDRCRDHGTWFDDAELQAILRWIRSGGESLAQKRDHEEARVAASAARFRVEPRAPDEAPYSPHSGDWSEDTGLVGMLARLLLGR